MNEPTEKVETLKPLTKFCITIGALPTSYFESLSYVEQVLWLIDYLQNTVIPTVNNNAEVSTELQNLYIELKNYVDNYFNNLDVQDEINNKIDNMIESGQFAEIVGKYLEPKVDKMNKTIYINEDMDLTETINNLEENSILILGNNNFTIGSSVNGNNNITILGNNSKITHTNSNNAINMGGNNITIKDITITNPLEWFPETTNLIYGTIQITGENALLENINIENVNKSGIYLNGDGKINNCKINANVPPTIYPEISANNQIYCIYTRNSENSKNIIINNCICLNSIEGVYFGDYYYPSNVSVSVINSQFNNMIDHSIYLNGGTGNIIQGNLCQYSNHAITTTGEYHRIENNTILLSANRLPITGVSLREPNYCKISNNIIKGNGNTNTSGIDLTNLSGDPIPNTEIKNVIINSNIFESTGIITPIRIGRPNQTTNIENITINDNIFHCETGNNKTLLNFLIPNCKNIIINNNNITSDGNGQFLINISGNNITISNNHFTYENLTSETLISCNVINGEIIGKITNNNVEVKSGNAENVNLRFYRIVGDTNCQIDSNRLCNECILINMISTTAIIYGTNNTSQNTLSKGEVHTNASGAYTVNNGNYVLNQSNVILLAKDQASAEILKNGYYIQGQSQGRFNLYVNNATTNLDLYYIIC